MNVQWDKMEMCANTNMFYGHSSLVKGVISYHILVLLKDSSMQTLPLEKPCRLLSMKVYRTELWEIQM